MKTRVSEKGRITIPKAIRTQLDFRTGQVLDVREEGGRLVATKEAPGDCVERAFGLLKISESTDRLIEELREKPDATQARRREARRARTTD